MPAPDSIAIRPWMTAPATARVLEALTVEGADVRFVGGCVRDGILGRAVRDVDIATPEPPARVTERLEAAGIRVVPTGIDHGTVTAVVDHKPFEVTTLREDVETFGRHARVAFTDDWRADAARRDFTMNAMSARADGRLFDYFGGWDDLHAGRVRFVGDAATRIEEDVLRLLRFYRFGAYYGHGDADGAGREACRAHAGRLIGLSAERVRDETLRLLLAPDPAPTLDMMAEDGVLAGYLPEAGDPGTVGALAAIEAVLGDRSAIRRLGVLLRADADALAVAQRLKLSNADRDRLATLHDKLGAFEPAESGLEFRRALYRSSAQSYGDLLLANAARRRYSASRISDDFARAQAYTRPQLPVSGSDVRALGIATGPRVGELLGEVEAWWIAADFPDDREAALGKLRAAAASVRDDDMTGGEG